MQRCFHGHRRADAIAQCKCLVALGMQDFHCLCPPTLTVSVVAVLVGLSDCFEALLTVSVNPPDYPIEVHTDIFTSLWY